MNKIENEKLAKTGDIDYKDYILVSIVCICATIFSGMCGYGVFFVITHGYLPVDPEPLSALTYWLFIAMYGFLTVFFGPITILVLIFDVKDRRRKSSNPSFFHQFFLDIDFSLHAKSLNHQ